MRIAFLLTSFPVLSETFILNQITGLIDRGHDVRIFANAPRHGRPQVPHAAIGAYGLLERTRYVPRRTLARLGYLARGMAARPASDGDALPAGSVWRTLARGRAGLRLLVRGTALRSAGRFDVVHAHFGQNGMDAAGLKALGWVDCPVVISFHGHDALVSARNASAAVRAEMFGHADACTANTTFLLERLRALGAPAEKLAPLPMGVDLGRFPFAERHPEPDGTVRIAAVGRLVESKGVAYAIRAVARLLETRPRLRMRVAGGGPLLEPLRALVRELGAAQAIELLGPQSQEQVQALLAESHLFMAPSIVTADGWEEAQGLVFAEASACGLPVVSTRTGGIPETVLDGRSGVLVPPEDVGALAGALDDLLAHPERWPAMGQAGRAHVAERFDRERLTDRLVTLYEALIRTGRLPP